MHRSRLSTILIDVPEASAGEAAALWAPAPGVPAPPVPAPGPWGGRAAPFGPAPWGAPATPVPGEEQFTSLPGALPSLTLAVQSVDDEARYHVDLETDNVDAETARLLALGAVEINRWLECRILRAPGGHLLCVIPLHSDDFADHATTWE